MARRGVIRNPRRTANTAAALLIGIALVGATTVMATSTRASVDDLLSAEMDADFMVQDLSYAPMTKDFVAELKALPGMTVYPFGGIPITVKNIDETMEASVADPGALLDAMSVEIVGGSERNADGNVILMNTFADQHNFKANDSIDLVIAPNTPYQAEVSTRVGAILKSAAINMGPCLTWKTLEETLPVEALEQMTQVFQIAVVLDPGTDLEQARQALTEVADPYLTITVMDQSQFANEVTNQINQMLNLIYALLALSIIIAVLGIVNTLALSVMERTREIGLMRAVGMGRGQLVLTTMIEGVLIALFGAALGLALGIGLAATLPAVLADIGLTKVVVNWATMAALLGVAGVVGVIAAVWPAIRAARLPVLTAVSYQ